MKLPFTIGNRPIQGNFDALAGVSKVAFPYASGIGDLGGGNEGCSYSRHGRVVTLQGALTKTGAGTLTAGDTLGTLPTGFRPTTDRLIFLVAASTSTAGAANYVRVDVQADGVVLFSAGTVTGGDWISLSGISFVVA